MQGKMWRVINYESSRSAVLLDGEKSRYLMWSKGCSGL